MLISLDALSQALEPLKELSSDELTFDVNGVRLTLRLVSPEQEVEVQRYANEALKEEGEDSGAGLSYLERFRLALLSHAICAVGDQDLRNVQYIETGDKLPNGASVKVPVAKALRDLIQSQRWSNSIRHALFRKYGELIRRSEERAERAIEFEPSDVDAEIERLEARIQMLKEMKEADQNSLSDVGNLAKALAEEDAAQQEALRDSLVKMVRPNAPEPKVEEPVETPPAPPPPAPASVQSRASVRQPLVPAVAPPPAAPRAPVPQAAAPVAPSAPVMPQIEDYPDSFLDMNDEAAAEAVAAENRRLFLMRQQGMTGMPPSPPSMIDQARRRPPHLGALQAAESVANPSHEPEAGEYSSQAVKPVRIDSTDVAQGSINPRFRRR